MVNLSNRDGDETQRLPVESLSTIFFHTLSDDRCGPPPIVLTLVCRRWREVAISISRLWSQLTLPKAPSGEDCLESFFKVITAWLLLSRDVPLSITLDISDESRTHVVERYLHLICDHSPRWKAVNLCCSPLLSQADYPVLAPKPHPYLKFLQLQTETPVEERSEGEVDWDLTCTGQALENAPNLNQIALTHSTLYELMLPWANIISLSLTIPDTRGSSHQDIQPRSFDLDRFASVLGHCVKLSHLSLEFDGEFSHLHPRNLPSMNACPLKLSQLLILEIISSSWLLTAYFLTVVDAPMLASFILDTHGTPRRSAAIVLHERFSAFLYARRETLEALSLRHISFASEELLLEYIRSCWRLRSFTMVDNYDVLGGKMLESLTLHPFEDRRNDSDYSNPFLENISIYRHHECLENPYPRQLYTALANMVKSRWRVPKDAVVDSRACSASKLGMFTLGSDDAKWMKDNLPKEWDIIEKCRREGLTVVINDDWWYI